MARILVIDDERLVRRTVRSALEAAGHEVLEASNGREALQIQATTRLDLVITDLMMPEKDGMEVLLALRRDAPGLKVIAMSGGGIYGQIEPLQAAEPLGAVASLQKPFTLDELRQTVERALAA